MRLWRLQNDMVNTDSVAVVDNDLKMNRLYLMLWGPPGTVLLAQLQLACGSGCIMMGNDHVVMSFCRHQEYEIGVEDPMISVFLFL